MVPAPFAPSGSAARSRGRTGRPKQLVMGNGLERWGPLAAGGVALAVYVATLAPTVHYGDGPELTLAAWGLGVAHPTGYPLYTLVGFAWSHVLTLGDVAWRMNLLSALFGGLSVGVLAATARRLSGSGIAAWSAALLFAFTPTFWAQATVAEVYTLHALILCVIAWALVRFRESACPVWARFAMLALGVGFAHHATAALLVVPTIVALVWERNGRPSPKEWARLTVLAAAPLALYAYLPLAAAREPVIAWGNPVSWGAFWYHVSAGQYREFAQLPGTFEIATRLGDHIRTLGLEYGRWFLPIALIGFWQLRHSSPLLLWTVGVYACALAANIGYAVADPEPYVLPTYAAFALWLACGAAWLLRAAEQHHGSLKRMAPVILTLAPAVSLAANFAGQDRSRDFEPSDRAHAALAAAPEGAILLTQGPTGYPPVYASFVERVRPDVEVVDMFLRIRPRYPAPVEALRRTPPTETDPRDLAVARAVVRARGRALLWPEVPDHDWEGAGLTRLRGGVLDHLVPAPVDLEARELAPFAAAIPHGENVEFLGAHLTPREPSPGGSLRARYYWRPLRSGPRTPLEVVATLADDAGDLVQDADGQAVFRERHPLGQGAPESALTPGKIFVETLDLLVPRHVPPGQYTWWVALRDGDTLLSTPSGGAFTRAASLEVGHRH